VEDKHRLEPLICHGQSVIAMSIVKAAMEITDE